MSTCHDGLARAPNLIGLQWRIADDRKDNMDDVKVLCFKLAFIHLIIMLPNDGNDNYTHWQQLIDFLRQADLVTSTFPDESPVVKINRHQENLNEWSLMTATFFGQNEKVFFPKCNEPYLFNSVKLTLHLVSLFVQWRATFQQGGAFECLSKKWL